MNRLTCLLAAAWIAISPAAAAPIVSYVLENQSSGIERDVPVTFGAVFAPGDIPAGSSVAVTDKSGNPIPVQVDIKARHKDGSLRHAVLTLNMPRLPSGSDVTVAAGPGPAAPGAPVTISSLPANFDAVVELTEQGSRLTASARDLIAHSKPETWLSGPLASEWWVTGPLRDASGKPDPLLSARFGIRSYGAGRPLRIEVDVENTWTWVPQPRTRFFDAEIRIGGKSVFTRPRLVQEAHSRWREVFWWDTPADVFVKHDLAYLEKTRTVPNYDPGVTPPNIGVLYKKFSSTYHGPLGVGIIAPGMGATGGRSDIGPLPEWTVAYLLTMDKRAAEITMTSGDLGGTFPAHYRNEKTGRPSTSEDFPKITTHYNYVGRGEGYLPKPDLGGHKLWLGPEAAHEPSLAFVPYLLTGERYYLEELQFWSQWNAWDTAPEYHGYAKGLIGWDQIRGIAWSLRTLAQAAYITPDADPLKGTLLRELHANAEWFDQAYTNNPNASPLHAALRVSDNAVAVAPWMDDFLTWAAQYAVDLGFDDWRGFARWKAYFPVQRMINPDFCYVMATEYYLLVMDSPHRFTRNWADFFVRNLPAEYRDPSRRPKCDSDEMAAIFKLRRPGEMAGGAYTPGGYPSQMQPALAAAVDAGIPGATQAWEKFEARPVKPQGGVQPQWDIVPYRGGSSR